MGQVRVHCLMEGIELPHLGSFKFEIITEGLKRKRREKVAFARMVTGLLAPVSGLTGEQAMTLLSDYVEELEQLTYNWKYETVGQQLKKQKQKQTNERDRLMERVNQMTVED